MEPITQDTIFLVPDGGDRISREGFRQAMFNNAAPAVLAERDPGEYFDAIIVCKNATGLHPDALYIFAIFMHESTCGKFGAATTTHSWGNTRPPSFPGALEIGKQPQYINGKLDGYFSIYKDWLDGVISTTTRLIDPGWVYAGRTRIIQIYDDPSGKVWAPPGDFNDVNSYIGSILSTMNRLQEEPLPANGVRMPFILTDRRASPNVYGHYDASDGMPKVIEAICCHISDGSETGDVEQLTTVVSANYYINKLGQIRCLVDPTECAWTNGPWGKPDLSNPLIAKWFAAKINPNTRTVSIEHEGKHGDLLTDAQMHSTIALIGWLCWRFSVPVDRTHIIGHYQIDSINRSYCPSFTDAEWSAIVNGALALQPGPVTSGEVVSVDVPGVGTFTLGHGFLAFYRKFGGLEIDGYPLTNEFQENGLTVQYFERSRYEWHPGQWPDHFDVMRGRLGAELLALKKGAA